MSEKIKRPYGTWPSVLTPKVMSQSLRFSDAQWDTDGNTLVWLEHRSDRGVLVATDGCQAPRDLTEQHSVRAGVGYGGGEFTVGQGKVVFSEANGRLMVQSICGGIPRPITPAFGRAASPALDHTGQRVLFVHSYEGMDAIALVDSDGKNWPQKLAMGCDFYMQPAWHPAGERIAWIEWDHPNMPWDGTRLVQARLSSSGLRLENVEVIAGDDNTPVFQPTYSPDGKTLCYITTHNDLDALVLYDLSTQEKTILLEGSVFASAPWIQGMRTYGWSGNGSAIFYRQSEQGFAKLRKVDTQSGESQTLDLGESQWFEQVSVHPKADKVALLASSSTHSPRVAVWSEQGVQIHRRSSGENIAVSDLSQPRPISWKADDQTEVHALYYPPTSGSFTGEGLPPALVSIHGGPTAQRVASYNSNAAFFTSRGFAFLEVNYRGSYGYGKAYLDALKGNWGVYDVEDSVGAAKALGEQKLADPNRLVIIGGSAGGYTVLCALTKQPGVFRAGICLYGISNLFTLVADTHKFEARYVDSLIGPLPEAAAAYRERSPIFHADQIRDSLAIFHGSEDTAVPPNQAEAIVAALRARQVPHMYQLYEGEGHGWRKAETIEMYYNQVMEFLKEHVLFS